MPIVGVPCHPSIVSRRIALIAAVISVLVAACGEAGPLDGVGDRTRALVVGDTTTTVAPIAVAAGEEDEGLVRATEVLWFNDDIDPQFTGEPDDVIASVWERQLSSRFVQSSRREIAAALPSLVFPSLVPQQVRWVTSQLVYNATSGTLDGDTQAAFGLWTAEPYRSDTAQLGVLRVGRSSADVPSARSEVVTVAVPDGVSLTWTESGHRYELFCRSEVSEDLCRETAESAVVLTGLLPEGR
jgi:hypothetical protein